MSRREMLLPLGELKARVLETAQSSPLLGGFASDGSLSYLFLQPGGVLELTSIVDGAASSCTSGLPLLAWDEREMRDERGIAFAGYPQPEPVAHGHGLTSVVVGPVHAGIIEPGRFTFTTSGEAVVDLQAQLQFSRRGIEQRLEGLDARGAARSIARICGGCSVARSWSYARALEAIAGVECEEPVELARIVLAELERLYNHLFDLASACSGAGYARGQMAGLKLKERVQRLCAMHGGHRFLFDTIVPGGVRANILVERPTLRSALRALSAEIDAYGAALFSTDSLVSRFERAGVVPSHAARALGAVGPAARASGVDLDVRVFAPYGAYGELQPAVATAHEGDVNARVRVKFAEARESLRLIDAALEMLGAARIAKPLAIEVTSGRAIVATEGPRGAETVCADVLEGRLYRLHVISASFRNWPVVVRAMEGNIIPDFPLVNKSFNLCYACADR